MQRANFSIHKAAQFNEKSSNKLDFPVKLGCSGAQIEGYILTVKCLREKLL